MQKPREFAVIKIFEIKTKNEFSNFIENFKNIKGLTFAEIKVANSSRDDLVRPKESALDNAVSFMDYVFDLPR